MAAPQALTVVFRKDGRKLEQWEFQLGINPSVLDSTRGARIARVLRVMLQGLFVHLRLLPLHSLITSTLASLDIQYDITPGRASESVAGGRGEVLHVFSWPDLDLRLACEYHPDPAGHRAEGAGGRAPVPDPGAAAAASIAVPASLRAPPPPDTFRSRGNSAPSRMHLAKEREREAAKQVGDPSFGGPGSAHPRDPDGWDRLRPPAPHQYPERQRSSSFGAAERNGGRGGRSEPNEPRSQTPTAELERQWQGRYPASPPTASIAVPSRDKYGSPGSYHSPLSQQLGGTPRSHGSSSYQDLPFAGLAEGGRSPGSGSAGSLGSLRRYGSELERAQFPRLDATPPGGSPVPFAQSRSPHQSLHSPHSSLFAERSASPRVPAPAFAIDDGDPGDDLPFAMDDADDLVSYLAQVQAPPEPLQMFSAAPDAVPGLGRSIDDAMASSLAELDMLERSITRQ